MPSEPTLVEDLETAALLMAPAPHVDNPIRRDVAARLRAAAVRLREEFADAMSETGEMCDPNTCDACDVLRRINGGPLP